MSITVDRANEIFADEIGRAIVAGLPLPSEIRCYPKLSFDRRKTALGKCQWSGIRFGEKINLHITISKFMLETTEWEIRKVLAHELCHTCSAKGHGFEFHKWANVLNNKYGYNIGTTATQEETNIFKEASGYQRAENQYAIKCTKCGHIVARTKLTKVITHPELYRCKCGGTLERIK